MKIKEIIVVEGKSDKQFLETFLEADIFTCNGSAIDGFDMEFLKVLAEKRGMIILTDPDYPGQRIRHLLSQQFPNAKHAFIDKEKSIRHHKVGVAESSKEEISKALQHLLCFTSNKKGSVTMQDLYELHLIGPDSNQNRCKVCKIFHLGHINAKTFLKYLNLLDIDIFTLRGIVNDK